MAIDHLKKVVVTKDTGKLTETLEVVHPAAKIAVMAGQSQKEECGDGSNFTLSMIGALLHGATNLLRIGLVVSDIIRGYKKAELIALEELEKLIIEEKALNNPIESALYSVLFSKIGDTETTQQFTKLVTQACQLVSKEKEQFDVDNVRTLKISGSNPLESFIIEGFAMPRDSKTNVKKVKNAKIAVYSCNVDTSTTETKATVLLKSADEMKKYNREEEQTIEKDIKAIKAMGINVVVTQGSFGQLALHFLEREGIMALKVNSKFQIQRLCRAIGASIMVRLGSPTAEEIGGADEVSIKEIGSQKVVLFDVKQKSGLATIVIRGATKNYQDEIERGVMDGVNAYKLLKSSQSIKLVPGGGASELELHRALTNMAEKTPGLDQYAIREYGEAFLTVPKNLAETSGFGTTDYIAKLIAAHTEGKKSWGVNIEEEDTDALSGTGADMVEKNVYDLYKNRLWGIKLATDAATSILNIDQIIMARPAGSFSFLDNTFFFHFFESKLKKFNLQQTK